VRNLSPSPTPSTPQHDTQFAVAVTGQDSSITLYTLEHQSAGSGSTIFLLANLHPITTLKAVHAGPISGITFAPAPHPSKTQTARHINLASIGSMANTCVIHRIPLTLLPPSPTKGGKTETATEKGRYILALKAHKPSPRNILLATALLVALLSLLLQGVLEVRGLSRSVIGARRVTPVAWHRPGQWYGLVETQAGEVPFPVVVGGATSGGAVGRGGGGGVLGEYAAAVADAAAGGAGAGEEKKKVVVLHAEGEEVVRVEGHDAERHGQARGWEDLHAAQKEAWKSALKKAGQWGEDVGEAVFRGVLFGEIAGVVGGMVA
jgi:hypothetical protein